MIGSTRFTSTEECDSGDGYQALFLSLQKFLAVQSCQKVLTPRLAAWTNFRMFLDSWVREMIAALIRIISKISPKYQLESFIAHFF
jgi:hypothetical protein